MNAKVIEAMLLLIKWDEQQEICSSRDDCDGCPFDLGKSCDTVSTDYVMHECATVFKRYIESEGK